MPKSRFEDFETLLDDGILLGFIDHLTGDRFATKIPLESNVGLWRIQAYQAASRTKEEQLRIDPTMTLPDRPLRCIRKKPFRRPHRV